MENAITLEPLAVANKRKESSLTPQQRTALEVQFAMWRMHLYFGNHGSYNTIERKINQGKLTPFVCPDKDCDCQWEKR